MSRHLLKSRELVHLMWMTFLILHTCFFTNMWHSCMHNFALMRDLDSQTISIQIQLHCILQVSFPLHFMSRTLIWNGRPSPLILMNHQSHSSTSSLHFSFHTKSTKTCNHSHQHSSFIPCYLLLVFNTTTGKFVNFHQKVQWSGITHWYTYT